MKQSIKSRKTAHKKTKLSKIKHSDCCNAPVELAGRGDFSDKDEVCTVYNVCQKCKQPCDVRKGSVNVPPKEWKRIDKEIAKSKEWKEFATGFCPKCCQVTNHLKKKCMKCKEVKPPPVVHYSCNQCHDELVMISWGFPTGNSVMSMVCGNPECPSYALLQVPEEVMYDYYMKEFKKQKCNRKKLQN